MLWPPNISELTYLFGHSCDVITDHEALQALLNTPHPSGKLVRWGLALQELDLKIHYRSGRLNNCADAFSRTPLEVENDMEEDMVIAAIEASSKGRGPGRKTEERSKIGSNYPVPKGWDSTSS